MYIKAQKLADEEKYDEAEQAALAAQKLAKKRLKRQVQDVKNVSVPKQRP